jgi:Chromo (CHRromatin Organisation MOdifier) domain
VVVLPVVYHLTLLPTWKIHNIFHVSLLTSYKEMEEHSMNFAELPPELIKEHEEYEVEQILALRLFGHWKKLQYLIHWKGYSHAHDSWASCDDIHAPDLVQAFHRSNPLAPGLASHIRGMEVTETPQLMSFCITENPTSLPYSQPFVTSDGMQHVQRTGMTLWPQDEYKLSWEGNDPPHFIRVVSHGNTPLSQTNALVIPAPMHDDDKSTMPTVRTGGGTTGGDQQVKPHEEGTDTLTTRHPNPWPISLARSNLSRHSHDEDWGVVPLPGAYYNNDNITLSYSLELEYLDNPTKPYTESQQNEAEPGDVPTNSNPAQHIINIPAANNLPELAIAHYDPVSYRYAVDNNDICIDTPTQPPHGGHPHQQPGLCHDHGHMLRSAGLALIRTYIWHYCAYVIRVHWMPRTGMP